MIALLLVAAAPVPVGPDAAAISELEFQAGQSLCTDFYHVVPCPDWRLIVSEVRCSEDPSDGRRALCTFRTRIPRARDTDTCSAVFESVDGRWLYLRNPDVDPSRTGFPSLGRKGPVCSATGAPDAAAIGAIWSAAHPRLSCSIYPEAKRPCPPASGRIEEVRCSYGSSRRIAHCDFRLHAPEEYYCRAPFRRIRNGWALTEYRGVDGRVSYDMSCNGPIVR